jgi:von Willebrand factor type A domain
MKRKMGFAFLIQIFWLYTALAIAGTSLRINYAKIDALESSISIHGINFDYFGPVDVLIGDTLIQSENCSSNPTTIECSLTGTPVLSSGGCWRVSLSAGNAPSKNSDIDVCIPSEAQQSQCNPGDIFGCYSGDQSTLNVGVCQSGYRTCLGDGTWSECQDETLPADEICGDGIDNDCDGVDVECPASQIDMIILLDNSGSMSSKWETTLNALNTFFNDQFSIDLQVGINIFPPEEGDQCDYASYDQLRIGFEPIPANANVLEIALNNIPAPQNFSPTYYAMQGTLRFAETQKVYHPTHEVIAVLVTDGEPNQCNIQEITEIAQLASNSCAGYDVKTYVLALGPDISSAFDWVAYGGCTDGAIDAGIDASSLYQKLVGIITEVSNDS